MFLSYVLFIPFLLPFSSGLSLLFFFRLSTEHSTAQALPYSRESQIGCILWRYVAAALTRFLSEPLFWCRIFFLFFVLFRFSYSSVCWCHLCIFEYIKKGLLLLVVDDSTDWCCHSDLKTDNNKEFYRSLLIIESEKEGAVFVSRWRTEISSEQYSVSQWFWIPKRKWTRYT